MLFPRKVRENMIALNEEFQDVYLALLSEMRKVSQERGKIRDKNTPIYIRRSPEENLGIAHGKIYRMESLLSQVNSDNPQPEILKKLIEEAVDVANYVLFIAALSEICLNEEGEV